MQEAGIEGPRMRLPGQKQDIPFYQHITNESAGKIGSSINSGLDPSTTSRDREPPFVSSIADNPSLPSNQSGFQPRPSNASYATRHRGESISAMSKRMDFSLGMKDVSSGDLMGDLYENSPVRVPGFDRNTSLRSRHRNRRATGDDDDIRESDVGRANSRVSESRVRFGPNRASSVSPNLSNKPKSARSVIHRNRFFSKRGRNDSNASEYDDLMEQGMADIPESSAPSERLDPRSGVVSPQAVKMNVEPDISGIAVSPRTSATSGGVSEYEQSAIPGESRTEAFEMRQMGK